MTDKIRQTYAKLSGKARLGIILFSLAVVSTGILFPAFATDPVLVANWWTPNGSGTSDPNTLVRCNVTDAIYNLDAESIVAKIDGQVIPATLDTYPAVGPTKTGTIRFTASNLIDGNHDVEVGIKDAGGNALTQKWSFSVMAKPKFSNVSPVMYEGVPGGASQISMVISDNGTVDWPNLYFRINGVLQKPEINETTGLVVYRGPFPKGQVDVYVKATDIKGNYDNVGYWFYNDLGNPKFPQIYYTLSVPFADGFKINDGILKFYGDVSDYNNVNITSLTATVDGVPLSLTLSPGRKSQDGSLTLTRYNFSGPVKDGNHTLVLKVLDQCGNSNTLTRTFSVSSPPVISKMTPVQYGAQELSQLVSAEVIDPNGTIVPESVSLIFDGVQVNADYDPATNKVTYQTGRLADESYHTATLSVKDDFGLTAAKTWKFYTNSHNYQDMSDANVSNCVTCHPSITRLEDHPLTFYGENHTGTITNGCNKCHNYITYGAGCTICHGDPNVAGSEPTGHGYTQDISYGPANYDLTVPLRVKTNREIIDCVICHQPGAGTVKASGAALNSHDIPEIHKYKAEAANCNSCHALSLTKEHARQGRVDKDGKAITCNTCHRSADPLVAAAIANKNTSCDACHSAADHEQVHAWNEFDANCRTCHKNTLSTEHLNRADPATGKNYACDTCHVSTANAVKRTIAAGDLSCAGCHQTAHKIALTEKVPADIPLYPGYEWTTPISASIFQGDPTTPIGYESGQVVISNRLPGIAIDQVWNYYNGQEGSQMAAKDWTLKSGGYVAGENSFKAEYGKEGRFVTIKCYKSAESDGSGTLGSGYRMELWYR